ncbi:MAG: RDD family protein, partial [Rubripirellula sp.]
PNGPQELASVGARIGGALLDGIAYILLMIPGFVIGGGMIIGSTAVAAESGEAPDAVAAAAGGGMILGALIVIGNLFVPMIINCVLIAKSGQSVGKKIVGTRMVDQDSGETSGFVQGFLIRTFVFQLICNIPFIGFIIALVDIIFLFTEGNQTLHDRLARTRVVKA